MSDYDNNNGGNEDNGYYGSDQSQWQEPQQPQPQQPVQEDSGYRYSGGDIPCRSYVDANYQPRYESAAQNQAAGMGQTVNTKQAKQKKQKNGISGWKVVAVCLVCALLGGAGGGALVATQIPKTTETVSQDTNLNIAESDGNASNVTPVSSGDELTGAQIYSLGCRQAVGVTSEITVNNFFGQQSTAAVAGSGFIVSEDGYIVTNYHVIKEAYASGYKISVLTYDGESYEATVVGTEAENDIAVLKINATGLSAVTFEDSENLVVGETIYCLGNPLGELNFSISSGMVSALDREITTQDSTTGELTTNAMFQVDAAINEGNSGGPVYNSTGKVVGMVTAKSSVSGTEGLGFAIPSADIIPIVSDIITNGYVTGKPSMGITVSTVDETAAKYYDMVVGAYVSEVTAGGCSEKAGLKKGDIITKIDDTEVASASELIAAKKEYKAGDTVKLTVYRDEKYIELSVTLDEETPSTTTTTQTQNGSTDQQNQQSQQKSMEDYLQGLFQ